MARPKKTQRTIFKNIGIPEDLCVRMENSLFSAVEGKIPFGAQQEFFTRLLEKHFAEVDGMMGKGAGHDYTSRITQK